MKTPSRKEAAALARQEAIGATEMNREHWWHMLPLRERQRAVSVAGFPTERASMPLATFSDIERERVRAALSVHLMHMELIAKCMGASNTDMNGYLH